MADSPAVRRRPPGSPDVVVKADGHPEASNSRASRSSLSIVTRRRVDEALARRRAYSLTLVCGTDVGRSYVLQLAVMTAVSLANRCFPGAVRIALDRKLADLSLSGMADAWPDARTRRSLALRARPSLVGSEGSTDRYAQHRLRQRNGPAGCAPRDLRRLDRQDRARRCC